MPTTAAHVWRPSAARTITLDAFIPVPRGTTATVPAPLSWPLKDPETCWTTSSTSRRPSSATTATRSPRSTSPSARPTQATSPCPQPPPMAPGPSLWLAAGQPGTTYTVTLTIGTQAGRTIARSVLLPVATLAIPAHRVGPAARTKPEAP